MNKSKACDLSAHPLVLVGVSDAAAYFRLAGGASVIVVLTPLDVISGTSQDASHNAGLPGLSHFSTTTGAD